MVEVTLPSILIIAGLLMTFFLYVATVSYRLGRLEQRVENNTATLMDVKGAHATKVDIDNLKETLGEVKSSISNLYNILRQTEKGK